MADKAQTAYGGHFLVLVASFVIVVAGMKTASSIIVPFLLALFIAIICSPPLDWLRRHKVPTELAFLIILIMVAIVGLIIVMIVGSSITSFSNKRPEYQTLFSEKMGVLIVWLEGHGISVPSNLLNEHFDPSVVMRLVAQLLTGLSGVLTNAVMILFAVLLILIEATVLPRKIRAAQATPERTLSRLRDAISGINNYLAIKTIFSFLTGALVALMLWTLGVDFPLLWGLLAFLLNFIPNIGSIIAAIPPILLALIQLGLGHATLAAAGFIVINFAFGNFIEPRLMGRRLGLSTLVIFASLVFWGWVLGPVGMFLSVPLTMVLKIALEHNERTKPIAILIGSAPEKVKT